MGRTSDERRAAYEQRRRAREGRGAAAEEVGSDPERPTETVEMHSEPPRTVETHPERPSRGGNARSVLLVLLAAAIVWVGSGLVLRAFNSGKALPGTSYAGVELGGLDEEAIADRIDGVEAQVVTVAGPSKDFKVKAPRAGFEIDLQATADGALDEGRGVLAAVFSGPAFLFMDREATAIYGPVNKKKLRSAVAGIAEEVDREPFVGALRIDSDSFEVRVDQPEAGVGVRRAAARRRLAEAFGDGSETMELPTERRAPPDESEVRAVGREAELYLQQSLVVSIGRTEVEVPPGQLRKALAIEARSGTAPKAKLTLGLDPRQARRLVEALSKDFSKAPRDAAVRAPASPPVTLAEQGDVSWSPKPGAASIKPARDGRRVNRAAAEEALGRAVRRGQHSASFPVEKVRPGVSTGAAKGATSLLGTFTTSYDCCQPRVTNIQQMARAIDGTVIGPGGQFSLNGLAGERTKEKGYKAAPSIGEDNELVDTVGGGVSQFSTTAYNAAYFAGLQLDAHTPHSFYISRYPPGREATLDFGSIELLWTNDTDTPVVVRSSASDTSVTVSIYGGNGGRKVRSVSGPRRAIPGGDFELTVTRIVRRSDGTRTSEPYTTSYGNPAE